MVLTAACATLRNNDRSCSFRDTFSGSVPLPNIANRALFACARLLQTPAGELIMCVFNYRTAPMLDYSCFKTGAVDPAVLFFSREHSLPSAASWAAHDRVLLHSSDFWRRRAGGFGQRCVKLAAECLIERLEARPGSSAAGLVRRGLRTATFYSR